MLFGRLIRQNQALILLIYPHTPKASCSARQLSLSFLTQTLLVLLTLGVAPLVLPPLTAQAGTDTERTAESERLEQLAELRFAEDDLTGAIQYYLQAAELHPGTYEQARILTNVAWLEHLRGNGPAAHAGLERALGTDESFQFSPENFDETFVAIYRSVKRRLEAMRHNQASANTTKAAQALERGDLNQARRELNQALEITPNDPSALYNLALLEQRAGNKIGAMTHLERILALGDPARLPGDLHAKIRNTLGLLLLDRQDREGAVTHLERAVELDPQNARAWNNPRAGVPRVGPRSRETRVPQVTEHRATYTPCG